MDVKNFSLADLKPYEKNPRNNDKAVDAVAKSIETFGFKVPIVIDKNNVIICGHTRYKAAQKLKLESVPCVVADDLSPEQIKAFRLADNKVSELATWNFGELDMELASIVDFDGLSFDMEDFGFIVHDPAEINYFFEKVEPRPQPAPKDNPVQEQPTDGLQSNDKPQNQSTIELQNQHTIEQNPPQGTNSIGNASGQSKMIICPHCGRGFSL